MMTKEELASIRDAVLPLMISTCTIQRKTITTVGLDEIETWGDHLTGVPCLVVEPDNVASSSEDIQAGRLASQGELIVRFPYGTDIHESDRILVTVSQTPRTLEVSRVVEHSYATMTSVLCGEAR